MAKAAKGFKIGGIFPVSANTTASYAVGAKIAVSGAQSLTLSPEVSDWKIQADDGIYDSGSDWNGIKATLTIAECPLALREYFEGGEYDDTSKVYTFKSTSQAPELAMTFQVLQSDGTWMMVQFFSMKATSYKMDYKTKGESSDISAVTVEFLIKNRVKDNAVKQEKEAAISGDLAWLDTVQLPAA
jgi:phi13 family phage major tail protein